MNNNLSQMAQLMLPVLDEEMHAVLQFDGSVPVPFLGMMHYQMGWVDENLQPIEPISGKRIRPLVSMLTCSASGGDWQMVVPGAAAIEILHNFSLVHDDIEDVSPTRRGRATVWKIWGEAQAINSGDAMFALCHTAMNRLLGRGNPPATVVRTLRRFDETCFQLTAGQHSDMDFETREEVSVEEYLGMITGKTAVLLSFSAELGATVAGASEETIDHYAQFGLNLGLAFQVIDDILGIWGDELKTGKSVATDITTKKKTLPVLYGLEKSAPLREMYRERNVDATFVSEVVQILDTKEARTFAEDHARAYSAAAIEHLVAAEPSGDAGAALNQLIDMLLLRDT